MYLTRTTAASGGGRPSTLADGDHVWIRGAQNDALWD